MAGLTSLDDCPRRTERPVAGQHALDLPALMDGHNVWAMQTPGGARLPVQPLPKHLVLRIRSQHLQAKFSAWQATTEQFCANIAAQCLTCALKLCSLVRRLSLEFLSYNGFRRYDITSGSKLVIRI